ncbi:hypothetical protein BCR35DRAFT_309571 [Leucosporidium creatinivorum]|uniref:Uncharacterized protein n=1 Tax=Leucosporidium creatinivorum TaxID=106004 RepID=A0A1Y2DEP4_9BASI|nr:hypothetical protein BCR35DRAFT_309571 [Leucosporidium creatinivorum]
MPSPLPARPRGTSPPRAGSSSASGSSHLPSAPLGGPPRHRPFSTLPSLPPKPVGNGLPERPTASALPRGDRADDGDRSPPRRGDGEPRRRGGAGRGGDDDWRGPPGSRPPRRGGWDMDRDIDRRRGGGPPLRDRSPDRFDSRDRFDRPAFDGPARGGRDDYRPPYRGGRSRSRSRSWSPPPRDRDRSRSRSRSPSRSPVVRRGAPNRGGRGGLDGPRYSGGSFRDRSPPPLSRRPRSPSPPYRPRSISRSPPPTHRQFGAPPRERTLPPISPDVGRRRSGGHLPPPSRGRSPSRSPPPHYSRDDRPPPSHSRRHSRELSSRLRSRSRSPPPHKRFHQGSTPPLAASARRPLPPPPQEDFTPAPPSSRGAGPVVHPSRMAHLQQPPSAPPSRPGSELEEGEVDMDAEESRERTVPPPREGAPGEASPYAQPGFFGAGRGRGFAAPSQPHLPESNIPTGPRNRFGGPPAPPPPPAARGGRGGMRGGMGGRAGGYGAPPPPPPPAAGGSPTLHPYDPSPSPVTPHIALASPAPPPPSTPAPPIPTGPKGWRGKPTPSSSTLPLPPMPGNLLSPQPLQSRPLPPQMSEEEIAAQQARAEQTAKEEQARMAQLVKDREMAMLKAQVQRWLPKTPFGIIIKPPMSPLEEMEAEIVRHRQHRLTALLPNHYARALTCRKAAAELGTALVEREVAKERLRMTEGGVAMSRGISSGL